MEQIINAIAAYKPTSVPSVRRYLRRVGVKPIGARQKPQRYPEDSALKILIHLGFENETKSTPQTKIASLKQLRTERVRSRRAAA